MYKKARLHMTVLCTIFTGFILFAMACTSLLISQNQLREKGSASFESIVNSIRYHVRSQNVLDHTWITQTEQGNGLILYIEVAGRPLYYTSIHRSREEMELLKAVRACSEEEHNLFISSKPASWIEDEQAAFVFKDGEEEYYGASMIVPIESGWAGLYVIKTMQGEKQQLAFERRLFLAAGIGALFLLFAFSWIFTGRIMKPIERNRQKQLEFVHAASHELRSPLAVIQTSLSSINDGSMEDAAYYARLAEGECTRMSRLVQDMLLLAGADSQSWTVQKEETEIETLMLTVFEGFEGQAAKKKISLHIMLPESPMPKCFCDGQRMIQVLSILLDNSISYTPPGGRVFMIAEKREKGFYLTVEDNGPGIPKEARRDIFNRFYRLDQSRTKKEHFGLGLSIAKEIVQLHKGRMILEDTKGGGASFTVILP